MADQKEGWENYTMLELREQVFLRPDTYIGSVEEEEIELFTYDQDSKRMKKRNVKYVPGLYKIFDEILVNASDNKQRDPNMKKLEINWNAKTGEISIKNDGKGIPIEIHKKQKIWVPEMIFGHMLTSSNYNDKEQRTTGGRNGYGAKLCNIFSNNFEVETVDTENHKKFKMSWKDHMTEPGKPKITKYTGKSSYTKVTFTPDYAYFGKKTLDADMEAVLLRRCWDIAGTTDSSLKVKVNGKPLNVKGFAAYAKMFIPVGGVNPVVMKFGDRWEVGVSATTMDEQFEQISFVNNIATREGGSHINHVTTPIVNMLDEIYSKGKYKKLGILKKIIKRNLFIFVNCLITNPKFTSQSKDSLSSSVTKFGSRCKLTDAFIQKIVKSKLTDVLHEASMRKSNKALKKNDGKKKKKLTGIPKLEDANDAGGKNSHLCTLILTEGDSAKTLAMNGLTVIGSDRYGVFPLRGKVLNVRNKSVSKVRENAEVNALKKIIGLKSGVKYDKSAAGRENFKQLRYGKVMIMADQDADGSHIKGLVINMFHYLWPELLKRNDFLLEFITPIVVCTKKSKAKKKKKETALFFTQPEYEAWVEEHDPEGTKWIHKYYKGLGSSTPKEAKSYFSAMKEHKIRFRYLNDEDFDSIKMAFGAGVKDRKEWIGSYEEGTFVDHSTGVVRYSDFINKELRIFSKYDCMRSIPSLIDGLKPSQRKIIYTCFLSKQNKSQKINQLVGHILAKAAYHHGDISLSTAIIGMAQDFVGSNNVPLLVAGGQFGTRDSGGKNASAPRYISTCLRPITRKLFRPEDDPFLNYQRDDGQTIEPVYYVPIIPLLLCNGAKGIATGFSTHIPQYNLIDLVDQIKLLLNGEELEQIHPFQKGFMGDIIYDEKKEKYSTTGIIEKLPDTSVGKRKNMPTYRILELPVNTWTSTYKEFLDTLVQKDILWEFNSYHTDNTICFDIIFAAETVNPKAKTKGPISTKEISPELVDYLLLSSSLATTSNFVLFDKDTKLKKYDNVNEIIKEFFDVRMKLYDLRKERLIELTEEELRLLSNKARFIKLFIEDKIKIRNIKTEKIVRQLEELNFDKISNSKKQTEDEEKLSGAEGYGYLLRMPIRSLTYEKYQKLLEDEKEKRTYLMKLRATPISEIYLEELDELVAEYEVFMKEDEVREREDLALVKKSMNLVRKCAYDFERKEVLLLKNAKAPRKKAAQPKPGNGKRKTSPVKIVQKKTARRKKKIEELVEEEDESFLEEEEEGIEHLLESDGPEEISEAEASDWSLSSN